MGIREDIEILDSKISRLKIEYEQYFSRILKREPVKLREEVDRLILLYSNQPITNTALKFRFHNLVAKYNAYKQYWQRILRAIEEGTYVRKAEGISASTTSAPPPPPDTPPKPEDQMREVYQKFVEARKRCNEPVDGLSFESLARTIEKHKKKIEEKYRTKDVAVKVYIKDGKAKIAITPKK